MTERDARTYIQELEKAPSSVTVLRDPVMMDLIRNYVDELRRQFGEVSDSDLGWMTAWFTEFIMNSVTRYGEVAGLCDSLMLTFAMMSRELLLLESAPETDHPR